MAEKTVIGVLASHDDREVNRALVVLLDRIRKGTAGDDSWGDLLRGFQLVFTGGTYRRVVEGKNWWPDSDGSTTAPKEWTEDLRDWLQNVCEAVSLPPSRDGGVTMLANLIAYRRCSILWGYLSPATTHWINPENLAIMRMCDHCRVKRLMNTASVIEWLRTQAPQDVHRNRQNTSLRLELAGTDDPALKKVFPKELQEDEWRKRLRELREREEAWGGEAWGRHNWDHMCVALIAHDEMKKRMVEFAVDFEPELSQFGRILTTGTTGKEIVDAVPGLGKKVKRCESGPKGGDIQIATETVLGYCDVVIFFTDPLHPHPHIDDIRVVFGACMARPSVRMITNEMQARDWMSMVVRQRSYASDQKAVHINPPPPQPSTPKPQIVIPAKGKKSVPKSKA